MMNKNDPQSGSPIAGRSKSGRRGRRPGRPDTRQAVLDVARRRFLADGYQAVTMRSIAAEAGVDAALISYFFGSKQGLFGAAMALSANPAQIFTRALDGELATLPERLVRALVRTWDDPHRGGPLRAMVTAAAQDPGVARLLREVLEREMVARLAERIGGPDATRRAGVAGAQLAGLIFTRYVLCLEPLASMSADELATRLAPPLRAALRPTPPRPTLPRAHPVD